MATDLAAFGKLIGKPKVSDRKPASSRGTSGADPSENPFYAHVQKSMEKQDAHGDGQSVEVTIPNDRETIDTAKRLVARAARALDTGYRARETDVTNDTITLVFWSTPPAADYGDADCPNCGQSVRITSAGKLRTHGPSNDRCAGSGLDVTVPEGAGA